MQQRAQKLILFCVMPAIFLCGSWALMDYSYRPGASGSIPKNLDSADVAFGALQIGESTARQKGTLIVFYHPHCPCTKATVKNLECIGYKGEAYGDIKLFAIAYCPNDSAESWIESETTAAFQKTGAEIVVDRNASLASLFGMATSGHVLFYDRKGKLLFAGGITGSRGHEGMCLAMAELLARLNGKETKEAHWPVFGCSLVTRISQ